MRLFDPKVNVTIVVEIKPLLELDDSREYTRYTHTGPPSGADHGGRCIGLDRVDGPGFVAGPPALPHEFRMAPVRTPISKRPLPDRIAHVLIVPERVAARLGAALYGPRVQAMRPLIA